MESYTAKANEQYKKCPNMDREKVLELKKWIENQPHLPNIEEYEVINFYHACFFEIDKSKECIEKYFKIRTNCPEYFGLRDVLDESIQYPMTVSLTCPLPGETPNGYKVIYIQLLDTDYTRMRFGVQLKLFSMVTDLMIEEGGIAEGYVMLFNMSTFVLGHLTKFGPLHMKKFFCYLQEAMPYRLKAIHIVNAVWFIEQVFNILRPFSLKDINKLFHVHKDINSLTEYVPLAMLPDELGGKAGTVPELRKNYYDHIMENANYFLREEKTRRLIEKK